ncbi:hypothetical protein D3C77_615740 [compost metagenome]
MECAAAPAILHAEQPFQLVPAFVKHIRQDAITLRQRHCPLEGLRIALVGQQQIRCCFGSWRYIFAVIPGIVPSSPSIDCSRLFAIDQRRRKMTGRMLPRACILLLQLHAAAKIIKRFQQCLMGFLIYRF